MASTISALTGGGGIAVTGDTSGVLELKTNNGTTAVTLDTAQNATFAGYANVPNTFGFKNRIINGAMVIDQRNAGASVTPVAYQYTLDRWTFWLSQSSKLTTQQNQGSITPPAGYKNYLGITSSSAYSVTASDYFMLNHVIEGYNIADLNWGTANAQTVTLSFWVRSSLTGTFGGSLANAGLNRSYPFTYSISAANTWEQKTITIAGDTTGTWATDNSQGIRINFGLGVGSTGSGTAGSWSSNNYYSATGAVSVVGTNGATFYITGVQLEKGSTATSFDYRDYGRELIMCQRYFEMSYAQGTAIGASGFITQGGVFYSQDTSNAIGNCPFSVAKRASPTVAIYSPSTGASGKARDNASTSDVTMTVNDIQNTGFNRLTGTLTAGRLFSVQWTASAEL